MIGNKYRIEGMLGEGSFAWVYIATHAQVSSLSVAIKVLKAEHLSEDDIVKRFHREAETAAALKNRHTIRITDFGFISTGAPYLAMEFVRGMTMAELLARNGPLSDTEVARLSIHILKALEEAHGLGIVHRDLKPDNVYVVDEPGEDHPIARVLDFGIAKIMDSAQGVFADADQTAAGMLFCTPRYAAPELLKGFPSPQSDVYALGITMIELLTGEPPYTGDDFYAVAAKHVSADPVPLGPLAEASALRDIVISSVAKKPTERYKTAKAMRVDLAAVLRRLEANSSAPTPVVLTLAAPVIGGAALGSAPTMASGEFASGLGTEGREILAAAALAAAAQDVSDGPEAPKQTPAVVTAVAPGDANGDAAELNPAGDAPANSTDADSVEIAAIPSNRQPWLLAAGLVGVVVVLLAWQPWKGQPADSTVAAADTRELAEQDVGTEDQAGTTEEPSVGTGSDVVADQGSGQAPDVVSVDGVRSAIMSGTSLGADASARARRVVVAIAGALAPADSDEDEERRDRDEDRDRDREEDRDRDRDRDENDGDSTNEGTGSQSDQDSNTNEGSDTDPNPFGNLGVRGGRGND